MPELPFALPRAPRAAFGLVLGALVLTLVACATTPNRPDVRTLAALEVVNRTPVDLELAVRGRVEGVLAPGELRVVRYLVPGPARLEARPLEGIELPGGPRVLDVELVADGTQRWELVPTLGEPLPAPAGLAVLTVRSLLGPEQDMAVFLGGRRLGNVLGGDTRRFVDLPAGPWALTARSTDGGLVLRRDLAAGAESEQTWELIAPAAALTVVNQLEEAIAVRLGARALARVEPGARVDLTGLATGPQELVAETLVTRRVYRQTRELRADFPETWVVGSGLAAVEVENLTPDELTLELGAERRVTVAPGRLVRIDQLPPGELMLEARALATGQAHFADVLLRGGQVYRWVVRPEQLTLRVENRTDRPLAVYVDDLVRGRVAPGASLTVPDLPGRTVRASAVSLDGAVVFQAALPLGETGAATWVVRAPTGDLVVTNDRDEVVTVYVEARRLGEVAPRSSKVFSGVEVGEWLVEAVGQRTRVVHRARARIAAEQVTQVAVRDTRAFVTVVNLTGEALVPGGVLAQQRDEIGPGERVTFAVDSGEQVLQLLGRATNAVYTRLFDLAPPDGVAADVASSGVVLWEVQAPRGALMVTSALAESAVVSLEGVAIGIVSAGQSETFAPVAAGRRVVQAQGLVTGRVIEARLDIPAEGQAHWELAPVLSTLIIENRTAEALQIHLDGAPHNTIVPGTAMRFLGLAPGARQVLAVGELSGTRYPYAVQMAQEAHEVLTILPRLGSLRVDNQSGEDVAVWAGGEQLAVIAAGAPVTSVPLPTGRQAVRLVRQSSDAVTALTLEVLAGQAVHLPVLPALGRLVVVNRAGFQTTLWVGARRVGVLEPGSSLILDDLSSGPTQLRAVGPAGVDTHFEQRTLMAGETSTWVLEALPLPQR